MKHVPFIAVILVAVLFFLSASAQQNVRADSMGVPYPNSINAIDSDLADQYLYLSKSYLTTNPDSSVYWAEKLLSLASTQRNWNYQQHGLQALRQAEAAVRKVQNIQEDLFVNQLSAKDKKFNTLLIIAVIFLLFATAFFILYLLKLKSYKILDADREEMIERFKNFEEDLKELRNSNNDLRIEKDAMQKEHNILLKANDIKDKLIPMIAHDIRSPLANLQNTLSLTRENIINPEEFQKISFALESDVFNLRGMLDNMLLWAREQMFEIKVDKVHFNLSETFKEVILMYRNNLVTKNITVHNYMPQRLDVLSDKEIMGVVIRNLFSNAVKFTEPNKNIYISQIFFNGKAYISIKDEGKGMQPEILEKINSKEHISKRGTANEKGTGLGLLFSSDLINKLEEIFDITSYPNDGTSATFSISIN